MYLSPATDRCLGGPLPHQLANRTRGHLKADCSFSLWSMPTLSCLLYTSNWKKPILPSECATDFPSPAIFCSKFLILCRTAQSQYAPCLLYTSPVRTGHRRRTALWAGTAHQRPAGVRQRRRPEALSLIHIYSICEMPFWNKSNSQTWNHPNMKMSEPS